MHRSRFAGFIIDCKTDDLDAATDFWSAAFGLEREAPSDDPENIYRELDASERDMHIEVQSVEHESRVHIDIEADDLEAEVARLEALGARTIGKVNTWWVMEAPTGQRFCVVNPQGKNFANTAREWP